MSDWARPIILVDAHVRLEPATDRHLRPLFDATDEQTFRYFTSWPAEPGFDAFAAWYGGFLRRPDRLHLVAIDPSGRVVGSSAYYDLRPEHAGLEVGFTFFHPASRRTAINPACKRLMLGHAFGTLGCERVQLKCDARNAPSRGAMLKLGCAFEGVHRRNLRLQDGTFRDTAFYSIVRDEWPAVRDRLDARLAEFTPA